MLVVKRIWGVTGDSLNGLNDSLRRLDRIDWMHVRHEETAAFAAGAEAAVTGELAVCAGSCGPGNLHLINGLFDCHRNHVPVLAIAAHIPSSESGSAIFRKPIRRNCFANAAISLNWLQTPRRCRKSCTVRCALRSDTRRGSNRAARRYRPAGRPRGSAHRLGRSRKLAPAAAEAELDRLAECSNGSEAVTILAGSGCAGAHDAVVDLARQLGAPVVHALRGKEHIEWDNPFDVGMTGLIGFSSGYHAMLNCDTLLMLGTDFPYRNFYRKKARIVQVDRDPSALGKRAQLALGIVGDVAETIQALLPRIRPDRDTRFLDTARAHYAKARKGLDDLAKPSRDGQPIHPQYLTRLVSELATEDAIFTADVGTPTVWAARYLKMNGKRRLIGSFNHGSMANAMLQAIGAQGGRPRQTGRFALGRWRLCHDDGGFPDALPA